MESKAAQTAIERGPAFQGQTAKKFPLSPVSPSGHVVHQLRRPLFNYLSKYVAEEIPCHACRNGNNVLADWNFGGRKAWRAKEGIM